MKFLRSYYKNKKVIMTIDGCQNCPLIRFNEDMMMSTCRVFLDKVKNENVLDDWVVSYNTFGTIFDKIKIPSWCELPDTMVDMFSYKHTFKPTPITIQCSSSDEEDDFNLEIISIKKLKEENQNIIYKILNENKYNGKNNNGENDEDYPFKTDVDYINNFINTKNNFDDEYDEWDNNMGGSGITNPFDRVTETTPIIEICSLCGEEHDTVNRTINNGMCTSCYDLHKNNKDKMNQSFINNFRLKRKINILHEPFKIVS